MSLFSTQEQHDRFLESMRLQNATYVGEAVPTGWTRVDLGTISSTLSTETGQPQFYSGANGAQGAVFTRTINNQTEVVISLRGSNPGDNTDAQESGLMIAGTNDSYYQNYDSLINAVHAHYGDAVNYQITGYSLGGGAANQIADNLSRYNFVNAPTITATSAIYTASSGVENYGHLNDPVFHTGVGSSTATNIVSKLVYWDPTNSGYDVAAHQVASTIDAIERIDASPINALLNSNSAIYVIHRGAAGLADIGSANDDDWHFTEAAILGNGYDNNIIGTGGFNVIDGAAGNDEIHGGNNGNKIWGGDGADTIYGGSFGDIISGGAGNDTLTGGAGSDTFIFDKNGGTDTVADFNPTSDFLDLRAMVNGNDALYAMFNSATQNGNNVTLHGANGENITVQNATVEDLYGRVYVNNAPDFFDFRTSEIVNTGRGGPMQMILQAADADFDPLTNRQDQLTFELVSGSGDVQIQHLWNGYAKFIWNDASIYTEDNGYQTKTADFSFVVKDQHGASSAVYTAHFVGDLVA